MIRGYTYDNTLLLKALGVAITSSAAATPIIDTLNGATLNSGVEVPYWAADAVIDVTAIDNASNDELYTIIIQLSASATFASGVLNRAALLLGNARAGSDDQGTGRYVLSFDNVLAETSYRYVRAYTLLGGGTTESITWKGFCGTRLGQW